LKDSAGNTIWTRDNVTTTDFGSVAITKVGSGSPSGVVAGTAGSSGVLPTHYWDYTNSILYVCTTTGSAATAVWTAINAQAATPTVSQPQGYLTLTSATPVIAADVSAATAVYYTPFTGNLIPIYNGSRMVPTEFSELTLTLVASHAASQIYDVFVFSNSSVLTPVTGPAWATPTAGAGARGTGAGTTQLSRLNGYWVNTVSMTGRNGSTTYSIGANLATYVGSIFMDGTNGQITCHRAWGASRKWGVWNAYNRQPLYLKCGDSTASWTYNSATVRQSRATTGNKLTTFCGLAEERAALFFKQEVVSGNSDDEITIGVGKNSTTAISGTAGVFTKTAGGTAATATPVAHYTDAPSLGIQEFNSLESSHGGTNATFTGTEPSMLMYAEWRG
jgi:hypothetical protein